jgi:hypothetical protein
MESPFILFPKILNAPTELERITKAERMPIKREDNNSLLRLGFLQDDASSLSNDDDE